MSGSVLQKVLIAVFSHGHRPDRAKRFRSLRTLLQDLLNCPAFCNQAWYGCVGILFIWNHTKLSTTSMLVHREFLAEHLSMFFPVSQTFYLAIVWYHHEDWWNSLWLESKSSDQVIISNSVKSAPLHILKVLFGICFSLWSRPFGLFMRNIILVFRLANKAFQVIGSLLSEVNGLGYSHYGQGCRVKN